MVDSERLIMVIENYQCIWNINLQDYHNKNLKDSSWNNVCHDLIEDWITLSQEEKNLKLNDIKKRWNNIRDYYKKEIDQQKKVGTGQPAKKRKKYVFADILEFLRPVFEHRNTSSNYENTEQELEKDTDNTPTTSLSTTTMSTTSSTTSQSRPVTNNNKNKKTPAKLNAFESSIIKALENKVTAANVPGSNLRPIEDDPDLMFLKSLLPDLKVLTRSQKFDFKIGIMQLLRSVRTSSPQSSSYTHDNYYRPNYQQNTQFTIPLHRNIRTAYPPMAYTQMPAYSPSTVSRSPTPTNHTSPITASRTPTPTNTACDDGSNNEQYILSTMMTNAQYSNTDEIETNTYEHTYSDLLVFKNENNTE